MRILITGSAGKIGRELVKLLCHEELLLVDKKIENANLAFQDLNYIKEFSPEIIIHLAASFERTDESPQFHQINYEDNILASYRLNQLIGSLKYCPKQYIFASSYLVYDPSLYLSHVPLKYPRTLSEVDEISPRNLIGASKLYVENEINFLQRNVHKEMKVTHARIFRVFGGEEFVSRVIEWKKMGLKVDIWKPENRFDFIHSSDCAQGLKALIGYEGVFNMGYGINTSIQSILDIVKPEIRHIQMNDLYENSCADTYNIEEITGWKPKINVLDWVKEQL